MVKFRWRAAWLLALAVGSGALGGAPGVAVAQPPSQQAFRLLNAPAGALETTVSQVLRTAEPGVEVVVDPANNMLIVRGAPTTVAMAERLIKNLDVPMPQSVAMDAAPNAPTLAQNPAAAGAGVMKAYPTSPSELDTVAGELQAAYPPNTGVRVSVDRRTSQVLVVAPQEVHNRIASAAGEATQPNGGPQFAPMNSVVPASATSAAPAPRGEVISLQYAVSRRVVEGLQDLWGPALTPVNMGHPDVSGYRATDSKGRRVELQVNRRTEQVAVSGEAQLAKATSALIHALDAPAQSAGEKTSVVRTENAAPAKIREAEALLRGTKGAPQTADPAKPAWREDGNAFVGGLFKQRPGEANDDRIAMQAPPGVPVPPAPAPGGPAAPAGPQAEGTMPFGNVQFEYIEGLDAFVIRGSERDVERVRQIIEDIERLSLETEPTIDIYHLKHTSSEQTATMVRQLYDEILSTRQGRVSITPLVKPNALMLVGQPDAVTTIRELISRIDQPVRPNTQFEVFALQHASAQSARNTIDEFYAGRTGMGTRVLVTTDFRSNSLIVQASPRDMAEVSLLIKRIDTPKNETVNEIRVIPLRNSLAAQLAPVLQAAVAAQTQPQPAGGTGIGGAPAQAAGGGTTQALIEAQRKTTMLRFLTVDPQGKKLSTSGILSDVRITADARGNALVVSAPPDSIALLESLVRELDSIPAAESQIKVFTIVNGDANSLATTLQNLFGTQTGGGGGFGLGGQQGLLVQGEASLIPLRFSVDVRTNSIIASGGTNELAVVEAILLRLDDGSADERKTSVYRLKNAPVTDVAAAINEFLTSQREVQQADPTLVSPFQQIERQVVVVGEPVSNSLIVSATPRYFDEIRALVEQLDARPPMVLIQVLIAEVTLNNTDEFGIELGLQDSVLFDRSIATAGAVTPGYNFNNGLPLGNSATSPVNPAYVGGQGLSNFGVGRTNSDLGFGGLVLSASSENVSVLIRALKEARRLDILSRPQVMTLDNQPAFVQVGQRVPRITSSTTNQNGQTNGTELINVGLILGVTPRISPDGLVVMEIDAERSEVGPDAEGIPISVSADGTTVIRSPRINTTLAQTTVSATSGQTIILGGLITKNVQKVHRGVPVIDNIPIVRNLFRFDSQTIRRTELLMIMTPHIVRTQADADLLKVQEWDRMHTCLADVDQIHGEAGLRGIGSEWGDHQTTVVYGQPLPAGAELIPTPAGSPNPGGMGTPNVNQPFNTVPEAPFFPGQQGQQGQPGQPGQQGNGPPSSNRRTPRPPSSTNATPLDEPAPLPNPPNAQPTPANRGVEPAGYQVGMQPLGPANVQTSYAPPDYPPSYREDYRPMYR